jgi:hypothetical protein
VENEYIFSKRQETEKLCMLSLLSHRPSGPSAYLFVRSIASICGYGKKKSNVYQSFLEDSMLARKKVA